MCTPETVGRGVYTEPYRTAGGCMVLVSVTSTGRRLTQVEVPVGDNPYPLLEDLWADLNARDPVVAPLKLVSNISATIALALCTTMALARLDLLHYLPGTILS